MSALFYNYKTNGDILFLVNEPESYPDKVVTKGDVVALYKGETLVGVNFLNIGKVCKIHADGLIVPVDDKLVDVVNCLLEGAMLAKLDYFASSGYKVGKVTKIEEHPLDEKKRILTLDLGGSTLSTVTRYSNFSVGDNLVLVTDGTIKFDGTKFTKRIERNIPIDAEVCSGNDLKVNDDFKSAFLANDLEAGDDFFLR